MNSIFCLLVTCCKHTSKEGRKENYQHFGEKESKLNYKENKKDRKREVGGRGRAITVNEVCSKIGHFCCGNTLLLLIKPRKQIQISVLISLHTKVKIVRQI